MHSARWRRRFEDNGWGGDMYRCRARAMCAALGLVSAVARAEGAVPAPSEGWHPLPAEAAASWSRLPRDGTWVGGVALAFGGPATTLTVTADAIRLREPGPEGIHVGMLLVGGYL